MDKNRQAGEIVLVTREEDEWERVVFAEVLIPETPNVFGDYWTREAIKEAAYLFMREGFGIDINHDNEHRYDIYVVETFIAREGDPDFIVGSWVVGMKIENDEIWQDVLDNKINGYSYEAIVAFLASTLKMPDTDVRTGITEPDLEDGHEHAFMVVVDENGRVVSGGTDEVNGHFHEIKSNPFTEEADGHSHRYNIVTGEGGI